MISRTPEAVYTRAYLALLLLPDTPPIQVRSETVAGGVYGVVLNQSEEARYEQDLLQLRY